MSENLQSLSNQVANAEPIRESSLTDDATVNTLLVPDKGPATTPAIPASPGIPSTTAGTGNRDTATLPLAPKKSRTSKANKGPTGPSSQKAPKGQPSTAATIGTETDHSDIVTLLGLPNGTLIRELLSLP
ncbi:hypothetical protein PGT21_009399 [Puccinia graminis f. sp. tritici]|uniref:Uncharacterized protein n=1 Tax=Puccinia graminis f. sp. tritici TaxID=56615 RepID=A0A5B0PQT1_PUCGR|nr:hypothetical protein PGT21_009399 [Puccinia graminis f. sp. tritici]